MANVKQVIVVRKDLNMPAGKLAAQVSHASTGAFLKHFTMIKNGDLYIKSGSKDHVKPWLTHEFTKICLKVNSEQELLDVHQACCQAGIPCSLIKDQLEESYIPLLDPDEIRELRWNMDIEHSSDCYEKEITSPEHHLSTTLKRLGLVGWNWSLYKCTCENIDKLSDEEVLRRNGCL